MANAAVPAESNAAVPAESNVAPHAKPIARPAEEIWGQDLLGKIQATFWIPEQDLYREETHANKPAFIWSASVQLSALAAAARMDPKTYAGSLRHYADTLRRYWDVREGLGGFGTEPAPAHAPRYYDDNAWMALALLETYEALHDPQDVTWAEDTFRFVVSGEDKQLGGGIYWREPDRATKNTCSTAPAIVAALRLYETNGNAEYLTDAQRLYAWMNSHLQDRDGLYLDHIQLDGQLDPSKWSYNSALMIESNIEFYKVSGDTQYLAEAERIAGGAEARWVRPEIGAIADEAPFAHLLAESFMSLSAQDGDGHWKQLAYNALRATQAQASRAQGHYGLRWDGLRTETEATDRLIDWASAAHAYWVAAQSR